MSRKVEIVRRLLSAYAARDLPTLERLVAPDLALCRFQELVGAPCLRDLD